MKSMEKNTIRIPVRRVVSAREFYAETNANKKKYGFVEALKQLQTSGYEEQFMPAILDARIEAPAEDRVWRVWYCSPSIRATGRGKDGKPVVVYAHVKNYLCNPSNTLKAIKQGLRNGAASLPQEEFQLLLDQRDDENIFTIDYYTLKKSKSDVISVENALSHPQTIPFAGGKARAEAYLKKHKEVYGDKIGMWHSDDLAEVPLARPLFVGISFIGGFNGSDDYYGSARLAGVSKKDAEGVAKNSAALKSQIKRIVAESLSAGTSNMESRLEALFK